MRAPQHVNAWQQHSAYCKWPRLCCTGRASACGDPQSCMHDGQDIDMHGPQPCHTHGAALAFLSAQSAAGGRGGSTLADEALQNNQSVAGCMARAEPAPTRSKRKREHLLMLLYIQWRVAQSRRVHVACLPLSCWLLGRTQCRGVRGWKHMCAACSGTAKSEQLTSNNGTKTFFKLKQHMPKDSLLGSARC